MNSQSSENNPDNLPDDELLPTRSTLELVNERASVFHAATINLVLCAAENRLPDLSPAELAHVQGAMKLLDEALTLCYAEASGR